MDNPIHAAWLAARRAHSIQKANEVLRAHGGSSIDSIPEHRAAACTKALWALAEKSRESVEDEPKVPKTLDEIRPAAFARFNNPPSIRRSE